VAKSAYRGVKYIKGLVNSELYKFDTTASAISVNTTPAVAHVSNLGAGDGEGQRTGNSVLAKSLTWNGTITVDAAGSTTNVRMVIVRDKQQIGDSSPSYTDIFESSNVYSLLNRNTVGRFDILYKRDFALVPAGNASWNFLITVPMQEHIRYNGTGGGDIQKNGLYIIYISDRSTGNPSMNYATRLSYHDN